MKRLDASLLPSMLVVQLKRFKFEAGEANKFALAVDIPLTLDFVGNEVLQGCLSGAAASVYDFVGVIVRTLQQFSPVGAVVVVRACVCDCCVHGVCRTTPAELLLEVITQQ